MRSKKRFSVTVAAGILFSLAACTWRDVGLEKIEALDDRVVTQTQDKILSRDYAEAHAALNKAVQAKDTERLKLGLKSPNLTIKRKAADALGSLMVRNAVPNLVEALKQNRGIVVGGSETELDQKELDKVIILSLGKITGHRFRISDPISEREISDAIKKSEEWVRKNKEKSD